MADQYTPSTDEARDAWAGAQGGYENEPRYRKLEAEFDRWLAAHDAQVLRDAADSVATKPDVPTSMRRERYVREDVRDELLARADRIAGGTSA